MTVRRATSHADPKAAATDGGCNLAAAYATTPATPPKSCPYWASQAREPDSPALCQGPGWSVKITQRS
jgi:hypothetical protein